MLSTIYLVGGLALAIWGANILVNAASTMAKRFNVSDLVIGATIVAFGTSCPELAVNVFSAIHGHTDLAMGNILGSNIFNILFILGVVGIVHALPVRRWTFNKDIPMCVLAAIVLFVCSNEILFDGLSFSKLIPSDGIVFFAFFAIFLSYTLSGGDKNDIDAPPIEETEVKDYSTGLAVFLTLVGLAMLLVGGEFIVNGAKNIAGLLGISDRAVGILIVGPGTSVPELLASLVAALKRKTGMAVGNIVGSNIFNVFFTLGLTSIIRPIPMTLDMNLTAIVHIAASILLFLFAMGHRRMLGKVKGLIFIAAYGTYITYVIMT